MKLIILLVFLFGISSTIGQEPEQENGILILTSDNFDQVLSAHKNVVVNFYVEDCSSWYTYYFIGSKKLHRVFIEAASRLR